MEITYCTTEGQEVARWTDEYGDEHEAYVEMVLAHDDEYPTDVVAAVVAAEAQR